MYAGNYHHLVVHLVVIFTTDGCLRSDARY